MRASRGQYQLLAIDGVEDIPSAVTELSGIGETGAQVVVSRSQYGREGPGAEDVGETELHKER